MKFRFYIFFILTTIPALFSAVQAQTPGKTSFNLFHPVPAQYLRDMETDRPDVTESPYTLDAGHIQYETDLLRHEREKGERGEQQTNYFNKGNLKLGLTSSTAFQFGFETFVWQKERAEDGEITKGHGIGDITLRIKQNILGNNGGNFILAVLPYVKIPTAKYTDDSKCEGGIIVPMMVKLPGEWRLAGQLRRTGYIMATPMPCIPNYYSRSPLVMSYSKIWTALRKLITLMILMRTIGVIF